MYWPAGAPRIYAASSSKTTRNRIFESDEDIALRQPTEASSSWLGAQSLGTGGQEGGGHEIDSGLHTPITPKTPAIQAIEQDSLTASPPGSKVEDISYNTSIESGPLLSLQMPRTGHIFAVITSISLTIWQTKPTAILAVVFRSRKSLQSYGSNVSLLVRPDSAIFAVQTTSGYLITYTLATDPDSRTYKPYFGNNTASQTRKQSNFSGTKTQGGDRILWGPGEGGGVREVGVRFRMVIKVDAGICKALALDDEIVVATQKPAAVQCIKWTPDSNGNQTSTELLSRMDWLPKKTNVIEMVYDRPMNLSTWITSDGRAYAVQRLANSKEVETPQKLFRGYCFHTPEMTDDSAIKAAINARFSLIAVGCVDGTIQIYTARDYVGNIPPCHSHKPSVSRKSSGSLTCLTYSPDGYFLFAGYEHGWAMWSVFGKPGASSFGIDRRISREQDEAWLESVKEAFWMGGGSEILMIGLHSQSIWTLEMARSSIAGCYTSANIARTLIHTTSNVMIYRGYDLPDLSSISTESSLWHVAQMPPSYVVDQWPVRCAVISSDGRYVAVAGRRGLAHYSVSSGRWKTFVNENMENEFQVRGGMCWHQHILIAALDAGACHELRLFSREAALDKSLVLHTETLPAPVVLMAPSGQDSLLVYTYDNLLYHYVFTPISGTVKLVQVGQIAFHGIVRSPARVRGLSWILPGDQLLDGDPSQDVAVATVLFLVDGKLVLLQPSLDEDQNLKYDMRVIAQNVEYYILMRDFPPLASSKSAVTLSISNGHNLEAHTAHGNGLQDSLWIFEGNDMKCWVDVQHLLQSAPPALERDLPPIVSISLDFYPLSVLLDKGIILGLEPELIQRRDVNFSFFRFMIRTHLFIPQIFKFHLSRLDSSAALHLAQGFQDLKYFAHSLEILLHNVLDEEVDTQPAPDSALLPVVLSFLSSFPQYLDIVVQCTRKTEVRSWRTLFKHLPPPQQLFEESLKRGLLKTAGGYLLVVHTFEELSSSSEQLIRLLSRAKNEGDWDLCKELARFLTALDESGATLREALDMVNLRSPIEEKKKSSFLFAGSRFKTVQSPKISVGVGRGECSTEDRSCGTRNSMGAEINGPGDYFSS